MTCLLRVGQQATSDHSPCPNEPLQCASTKMSAQIHQKVKQRRDDNEDGLGGTDGQPARKRSKCRSFVSGSPRVSVSVSGAF